VRKIAAFCLAEFIQFSTWVPSNPKHSMTLTMFVAKPSFLCSNSLIRKRFVKFHSWYQARFFGAVMKILSTFPLKFVANLCLIYNLKHF